jgi:hypothetical protein
VERQIFGVSTYIMLGDESTNLFWEGKWLNGCSIQDIAPDLVALISGFLLLGFLSPSLDAATWLCILIRGFFPFRSVTTGSEVANTLEFKVSA